MEQFKGTKGKWEIIEHNWSDSSIMCGDGVICTNSIYDDATEENQEQLESEMIANMTLIASAPEMLDMLIKIDRFIDLNCDKNYMVELLSREVPEIKELIKKATEI